ncbi:GTPase-associated system all-helical protein GASH [Celerinatantimonas diazotrophica]|uniref:GTPase-associated system helical domain-containing protein n=1 Tax=Celerinatantimonas diazotrophica TaxID=412034 RepID=A0A4R1K185_9GAMM|nr:GTPase-associated system all-helical protein GASH [Celerinatantimonas diazotrophica]TCK57756.1 hypothetical protein EV690_1450 [Celerinatantimonas diazotrophica]CAG9298182.1 hypothetical protein CEDIAZO_03377 [Celerinatantimonas diazotrophica]
MTEILTHLLAAGLIENIDGDETRFGKIEVAAQKIATELTETPKKLIPALLAGINPDVNSSDPAIEEAQNALVAEWKTMSSAYPSPPINLFRAILLEACRQAAEKSDKHASVLWLTAADSVCLMRLSKEESVVRNLLKNFAEKTERWATSAGDVPKAPRQAVDKLSWTPVSSNIEKVNRQKLRPKMGDAAGNSHIHSDGSNKNGGNPNNNWPSQNAATAAAWAGDFAERMTNAIGDELDNLSLQLSSVLDNQSQNFSKQIEKSLNEHRKFIQRISKANLSEQQAEITRLNVLWWSEALYSISFQQSYRELELPLAIIAMPWDLLSEGLAIPTPASVSYMLSESVCKLEKASFEDQIVLCDLLALLSSKKDIFPKEFIDSISAAPLEGMLTLRDLVALVLKEQPSDLEELLKRANIASDFKISVPVLSRAVFRQEQAIRLIEEE